MIEYSKEEMLKNLEELQFLSRFIYRDSDKEKKKLKKKMRKLIHLVEEDKVSEFMTEEYYEG